jgi:hypothetical protein
LYCNGQEICDFEGNCQQGTAVDCKDEIDCTQDSCDEEADSCENQPDDSACDNGEFCDGDEWCDPLQGCQSGDEPCQGEICLADEESCVACREDGDCIGEQVCNQDGECEEKQDVQPEDPESGRSGCGTTSHSGLPAIFWLLLITLTRRSSISRTRRQKFSN